MRVLIWHVHGSWTTSFVQGAHTYLLPVVADRGPDGRGRATTWDWPSRAVELSPDELADAPIDVVVVQRDHELELCEKWLGGRRLGRDVPVVWLEHNAPQGRINDMRHPVADRHDVSAIVHVTPTNALFWDNGDKPVHVIEHGIVDPGERWTGEHAACGVVVNEPVRRGRVAGTDLLPRFGHVAPVRVFGMDVNRLTASLGDPNWLHVRENLVQDDMHGELARCRCYVHPYRWTSLGLSLVEAMHMGMPVVSLATTATPDAVPAGCGVVSNDVDILVDVVRHLCAEWEVAAEMGRAARAAALRRFGLARFLSDWNDVLEEL